MEVVALTMGTAAVHLALITFGVSRGDEVITQRFYVLCIGSPRDLSGCYSRICRF